MLKFQACSTAYSDNTAHSVKEVYKNMFYAKARLNGDIVIKAEITDSNIYAVCERCNKEFKVNVAEMLNNKPYCHKCSIFVKRHSESKNND